MSFENATNGMHPYGFPEDMPTTTRPENSNTDDFSKSGEPIFAISPHIPIGMDTNWYGMPFNAFVKKMYVVEFGRLFARDAFSPCKLLQLR